MAKVPKQHKAIPELNQLLAEDSPALDQRLNALGIQLDDDSVEARTRQALDGTLSLALDVVRKNSPALGDAVKTCRYFLSRFVVPKDVEDPREDLPMETLCDLKGVKVYATSLMDTLRDGIYPDANLITAISWICKNERGAGQVLESGVHKQIIQWAKSGFATVGELVMERSLAVIQSTSRHVVHREKLREDGALEAALAHVKALDSSALGDKVIAFRISSIFARLAGNDETGPGPQILRGNPALIEKQVESLDKVLDIGPKNTYLNMLVNPRSITVDMLVIAVSDVNRPLLKSAIPVLIKALELRGATNPEMVVDVVQILLQLTYDPECLALLTSRKKDIAALVSKRVVPPKYDMEARRSAQNLMSTLEGKASVPPKAGLFGWLRRKSGSNAVGQPGVTSSGITKHIMLSYNWSVKPIVRRVDEVLRANGFKTWLDERDMGPNLNDSMAGAIENSAVVFVFLNAQYKESANCRRECEYADGNRVPIVYIMAEEGYQPNGWLGIQLGKAVWVAGWTKQLVDQNTSQLLERARSAYGSSGASPPPQSPTKALPAASGDHAPDASIGEVLEKLKAMQAQLDALQEQVRDLQGRANPDS